MTTEQMKAALRQIHGELESQERVDPELRALLQTLETDIHGILDQPTPDTTQDTTGVTGRLDSMAVQFETEYPQMAPVLRQVGEALARMGM